MKKIIIILTIIFIIIISYLLLNFNQEQKELSQNISETLSKNMKITSSVFENNQNIPKKYSCDGENINPTLTISEVPQNAKSLVLIMDDPDAPMGTWVHWTLWNIDPLTKQIEENNIPASALNADLPKESKSFMAANQGLTSFGKPGYGGPCPPSGTHRYFFKLYALNTVLNFDSPPDKKTLEGAIQNHILDQAELVGLYKRN